MDDKESAKKKKRKKKRKPKKKSNSKSTPPIVDEILAHEDYYEILGTTKAANDDDQQLKKLYRKRAVQTHPDKTGGDRRAFDKVAEAYENLETAEKRNIYNRYGKEGAKQRQQQGGMGGGGSAEDLFRSFFGGSGNPFGSGGFGGQQQQRNRTSQYQLEVTLEDLYRGKTMQIRVPGGKTVSIEIPVGGYDSQNIVLSGESDANRNQAPGDLIFILAQRQHATFARRNHDLACKIRISLAEALTGVQRTITHLDGRVLHVVSAAHRKDGPAVISAGDVQVLKGQGMPKDAKGSSYGDLYIQYEVTTPSSSSSALDADERRQLQRLLNKLEGKTSTSEWPFDSGGGNDSVLQPARASDFGRASGQLPQQQQQQGFDPGFSPFGQDRFYWSSQQSSNPYESDQNDEQCLQM